MADGTKLTQSNGAGGGFALPGFGLMLNFVILPFFFAFGLSLTNQRLISPNLTEFFGLANYRDLLGLGIITLAPVPDDAGAIVADENGDPTSPKLRDITRNNPEHPSLDGMREWFSWTMGDARTYVLARDVIFMNAAINTLIFVIVVAPVHGGLALGLALLINQRLSGINLYPAIFYMPVVVSIVVVSLLWRFIYDGQDGLLNNLLSGLTFGAFPGVDWLGNPNTALGSIIVMSIWQAVG